MLKRFRQQKTVSCAVRIGGGQPFEVHGQLLEYGRRLMGAHRLTDEFLNFILSLLDEKACLEIGERLFGKRRLRKSKRRESLFDDDVADILKPDVLAQRISVDLLGGRLGIGAGSLERYLLTFIEKAQRKAAGSAGLQSAMKELARMFGFNEDEIGFVTFLFCKVSHEPFSNLCFNLRLAEYTGLVSIVTGMTNERMRAIIGARQKLQLSGVVIEEEFGDPGRGDRYSLDVNIVDYLTGIAKVSLAEKFCRRDDSPVIPLSRFK
ncbi:MAG: hypothetical protein FJ088_15485, partial [Deltaproteobacteria bacterium]|nr:hypothetical protein [Deltaproteobacteria bacterium]